MKKLILVILLLMAMIVTLTSCDIGPILDPLFGHIHSYGDWEVKTNVTCTTAGEKVRYCSCGDIQKLEIEPTGHNYGEWFDEVPATTEKEGTLGHYHCSACKKNFDTDKNELASIVIPKLGNEESNPDPELHKHTESGWIVDKEATCTEEGSQYKKCIECGEEIDREPIQKKKHNPGDWIVDIEPTHETEGHKYKKCTSCGNVIEEETIPKLLAYGSHYIYYFDNRGVEIKEEEWPKFFTETEGIYVLPEVEILGYETETNYWRDEYGNRVWSIPIGTNRDIRLFAVPGELIQYEIEYKDAPLANNRTTYTIKDEFTLLDASWSGFLKFDYWTDETGERITSIEKGTVGKKILTAHWISEENYAVENTNKNPTNIIYTEEEGRYYFIYELGTIYNVVLRVVETQYKHFGGESLSFTKSETVTVEEGIADSVATTVSNSTTKTEEWNETREVSNSLSMSLETSFSAGWEGGCELSKANIQASIGITTTGGATEGIGYGNSHSNESTETNEETVTSTISYTKGTSKAVDATSILEGYLPTGWYNYVCTGKVTVYAIVTYDAKTGNYHYETLSVLSDLGEMRLYTPSPDVTSADIKSHDALAFDVPVNDIYTYVNSSYYVQYDANGTEYGKMYVSVLPKEIETHTLSENTYVRPGYIFAGWSTTPNGTVEFTDCSNITNEDYIRISHINCNMSYDDCVIVTEDGIEKCEKSKPYLKLYAVWKVNPYTIGQYVSNGTTVIDSDGENKYVVYNTIDGTPFRTPKGNVIIDWSRETDTNMLNHTKRSVENGRYNVIDIVDHTSEVTFVGTTSRTFTNLKIYICAFEDGENLKIRFVDFNFTTNESSAIGLYADGGVYLTIDVIGNCSIKTQVASGYIIGQSDAIVKNLVFTGSGNMSITGGNGANATSYGGNGGNGGVAIRANQIIVYMTGALTIAGGNGGNGKEGTAGTNGKTTENKSYLYSIEIGVFGWTTADVYIFDSVNGGNGGKGGNGGDGAKPISDLVSFRVVNGTVKLCYGNGGNGAKGGNGGDGANGHNFAGEGDKYYVVNPGNGGNGGTGGDGGNAGRAATDSFQFTSNVQIVEGCNGNAGAGGDGGAKGTGGTGGSLKFYAGKGDYSTGNAEDGKPGNSGKSGNP